MTNKTYPPLPYPHDYYYEWDRKDKDSTYRERSFRAAPRNGRNCDRVVAIYTEAQMREYVDADRASHRLELQREGKHPAPCARFCEANAFEVEIRQLRASAQADALDAERYRC